MKLSEVVANVYNLNLFAFLKSIRKMENLINLETVMYKNEDIKELDKVCRGCLAANGSKSIFTLNFGENKLSDVYSKLTGVQLEKGDGLPENFCITCISLLNKAQGFVEQCQTTNKTLLLLQTIKKGIVNNSLNLQTIKHSQNDLNCQDITEICVIDTNSKTVYDLLQSSDERENDKNEKSTLKCRLCLQQFSDQNDLCKHYWNCVQCPRKSYKCKICNKTFPLRKQLLQHNKKHTKTAKEFPFKCEQCPKVFVFSQNLARHKKLHVDEKPYKCHLCKKAFTRAVTRDEHIRNHTGESPYACAICGKTFKRYATHYLHMKRHEIKNAELKHDLSNLGFQCEVCSKCFATTWDLKLHKNTHISKEKCLTRSVLLTNKQNLHLQTHINNIKNVKNIIIK